MSGGCASANVNVNVNVDVDVGDMCAEADAAHRDNVRCPISSCQYSTKQGWLTEQGIRRAFVAPVNKQRREMAGSVILYVGGLTATSFSLTQSATFLTLLSEPYPSIMPTSHTAPGTRPDLTWRDLT
jgi:hypothetical protein